MISDLDGRWELVGGCPTPGNPQDIEDLGANMHARARQSQDLYDRLRGFSSSVSDAGWHGRIADAFLVGLEGLGPVLRDQHARAEAVGRKLEGWSQALRDVKGRALALLCAAEDSQLRARDAGTAPDEQLLAEAHVSAIRAQVRRLAEQHRESAVGMAALVSQQTAGATPAVEGLLAATIHAVAPGHPLQPDPDDDGAPQIRALLGTIEGSWMGHAEYVAQRLVDDEGVPDLVLGGVISEGPGGTWLGWEDLAPVAVGDLPLAERDVADRVRTAMAPPTTPVRVSLPAVGPGGRPVGVALSAPPNWRRIQRQGLLRLAAPVAGPPVRPPSRPVESNEVSAGLAIRIQPLESSPSSATAAPATTPDILRAAMLLGDGMTSEVFRPLDRPVEVLMRGGFGVRRAYLGRVGDGPPAATDRVVLIDRFLFARDTMLVSADFHTSAVGLRDVLRPLFTAVAMSLEISVDG